MKLSAHEIKFFSDPISLAPIATLFIAYVVPAGVVLSVMALDNPPRWSWTICLVGLFVAGLCGYFLRVHFVAKRLTKEKRGI